MILLIVGLGLGSLALLLWIRNAPYRNAVDRLPGPKALPVFGNALEIGRRGGDFYRYMAKLSLNYKEEGLFRVWIGSTALVGVHKAELLEPIFSSTKNNKKNGFYSALQQWLQDGLLLSYGPKWQVRRKLLTPTFHYSILEEFVGVFEQQSRKMVSLLEKKVSGPAFNIQEPIINCTLDIIGLTAMGVDINAQEQTTEYVDALHRISAIIMRRTAMPWLQNDLAFALTSMGREHAKYLKILHDFTRNVIVQRWDAYDTELNERASKKNEATMNNGHTDKKRKLAFLDLLISKAKEDGSLSINDIQEEVDTFMFEGHDTTSSAITWAMYALGHHQECQEKVRDEIMAVVGADEPLTITNLNELKYTENFLKESMRLYTTVPFYGRRVTDPCKMGDFDVPIGADIAVLTGVMHRDPTYFPDPDKFDPDRWLGQDIAKRHPFCYVPFSAGPRNCIGQRFAVLEEKAAVCNVLRAFRVTCDQQLGDLDMDAELVLRPTNGLFVQLHSI